MIEYQTAPILIISALVPYYYNVTTLALLYY